MFEYLLFLFFISAPPLTAKGNSHEKSGMIIFQKMKELNTMREVLASTLKNKTDVTETDFKTVCMPVGKELQRWGQEKGYQAIQISHKNRNPKHAIPSDEKMIYQKFLENGDRIEASTAMVLNNQRGIVYHYRVDVSASCLACHGAKDLRPEFIKVKYPNDLAFDFKVGELRGLYSVFVPN